MGFFDEIKKLLFVTTAVGKNQGEKAIETIKEKSSDLFDKAIEVKDMTSDVIKDKMGMNDEPKKETPTPKKKKPIKDDFSVEDLFDDDDDEDLLSEKRRANAREIEKNRRELEELEGKKKPEPVNEVEDELKSLFEDSSEIKDNKEVPLFDEIKEKVAPKLSEGVNKAKENFNKFKEFSNDKAFELMKGMDKAKDFAGEKLSELSDKSKEMLDKANEKKDELHDKAQEDMKRWEEEDKAMQERAKKTAEEPLLKKHQSFFDKAASLADKMDKKKEEREKSLFDTPKEGEIKLTKIEPSEKKTLNLGKITGFDDHDGDGDDLIDDAEIIE